MEKPIQSTHTAQMLKLHTHPPCSALPQHHHTRHTCTEPPVKHQHDACQIHFRSIHPQSSIQVHSTPFIHVSQVPEHPCKPKQQHTRNRETGSRVGAHVASNSTYGWHLRGSPGLTTPSNYCTMHSYTNPATNNPHDCVHHLQASTQEHVHYYLSNCAVGPLPSATQGLTPQAMHTTLLARSVVCTRGEEHLLTFTPASLLVDRNEPQLHLLSSALDQQLQHKTHTPNLERIACNLIHASIHQARQDKTSQANTCSQSQAASMVHLLLPQNAYSKAPTALMQLPRLPRLQLSAAHHRRTGKPRQSMHARQRSMPTPH